MLQIFGSFTKYYYNINMCFEHYKSKDVTWCIFFDYDDLRRFK